MHKRRIAFSLAEVLVVVYLIGIIAIETIPIVVNTVNDKKTAVAAQKPITRWCRLLSYGV